MKVSFWSARQIRAILVVFVLLLTVVSGPARAQTLSSFDRERARLMLEAIKSDVKNNYYDTTYHGINLDEHFKKAEEKLKNATSIGQTFGIIAQALLDFNDSHLFFIPPGRAAQVEYGWQMRAFGDKVFVTAVKPGSDAEAKGLKPGDEVVSIDGFTPNRDELWKIQYFYYALRPRAGMKLQVRDPKGVEREVIAMARVDQGKRIKDFEDLMTIDLRDAENESRLQRNRMITIGDELAIWKMPTFVQAPSDMDHIMGDLRKYKTLIIDLRGNGGGRVDALERLVGNFFDKDVKIAELKGRKKMDPQVGKSRGDNIYKGKLIVLVDSGSGSASEIFARVVQLEKRGIVIGDRSAGAVMQSMQYSHTSGVDIVAFYGASITNADVIMSDGKSLEFTGVTPDELWIPTAADLAAGMDPVLAHAASLAGVEITPEKAGTLFPVEWKK